MNNALDERKKDRHNITPFEMQINLQVHEKAI